MQLRLKRVYEQSDTEDGTRILIDRLWPRGVTKEQAQITLWLKEIAPSNQLRQWFGHDPAKWDEFKKRYFKELDSNPALIELRVFLKQSVVTLVFAAKDPQHNHAVALKQFLESDV